MADASSGDGTAEKKRYWDSFYRHQHAAAFGHPSQFAAFVAQEASGVGLIVDVGCGNGRDSAFFARQGFSVLAIDGSSSAIEGCVQAQESVGVTGLHFANATVESPRFAELVAEMLSSSRSNPVLIYARFFLHAITDEEENIFLSTLARHLVSGDRLAFEYRTVRDVALEKVTPSHFRRFVSPSQLLIKCHDLGFDANYLVEGFGFAKYKADDAYVARSLFTRNPR